MESAIYIVATPIGNLSDITLRAIEVLKGVDFVAAEDTRHTRKLLDHYGIEAQMISLHDHNEVAKSDDVIGKVVQGASVALVSDAGTPLISDPGYTLVAKAKKQGVSVRPIPGPSALIAALCASGIASDKFIFEGFLPAKSKAREGVLQSYQRERRTVIFYESPHRIISSLEAISQVLAGRKMCVARELTKRYETIRVGAVEEVLAWMKADDDQKRGEFVLVLAGSEEEPVAASDEQKIALLARLMSELPPKKASAIVSDVLGGSKKEIYSLALSLQGR